MKKPFKYFAGFVVFLFSSFYSYAQPDVQWQFSSTRISVGKYEIKAEAVVPDGWHIYGINKGVEGLDPATFHFDFENVKPDGEVVYSPSPKAFNDTLFGKVLVHTGKISFTQNVSISQTIPSVLKGNLTIYSGRADEFYPIEKTFEISLEGGATETASSSAIKLTSVDLNKPLADCGKKVDAKQSLWGIFILGFLGGLIALLTPCVFPMIPVTVSFFTRRSANRQAAIKNGVLYGTFIFLIYIIISLPFHLLGNVNPEIFNNISTNAYLNIIFFAVFIFFSISFFGYFDITLPGSVANKADEKSGLGSIGGIFFMSLTLAIVSFSCTGPILGSLLVGSLSGGAWQLTAGLGGFGIALALPFALFAIFPDWLKALPKSGGWLDTVKKILAFAEVALAFKFLSNADLVMHWGVLKREVFIGIWLLVGIGLTLYLFGVLRLPHDTKGQKISVGRKMLGVLSFLFTLYLIPGVTQSKYANLKLLSGFPPPLSYSVYGKENVQGKGLEANVINDYNKALQLAREQNKPILIDFTGWACVNCRKMEENVWTQPEVNKFIKDNYILVSLYVDDRSKLPIELRTTYTTRDGNKKDIYTQGDKWATFEAENFNQVSQPLYVVLDTNERLVTNPVGYTPDAKEYLKWLTCGKNSFKE